MAASLGIGEEEFRSLYVWRRYGEPSLRERANYDCVFLRKNPCMCAVYESRPSQCREFPFWPDVLKSRSSWNRFAVACPGMNHGDFHPHGEIISRLERQFRKV
jgi:Fe-S-cluster containining protein